MPVFTYYHSPGLLGRSSNISASISYAIGTFEGEVVGSIRGLVDPNSQIAPQHRENIGAQWPKLRIQRKARSANGLDQ